MPRHGNLCALYVKIRNLNRNPLSVILNAVKNMEVSVYLRSFTSFRMTGENNIDFENYNLWDSVSSVVIDFSDTNNTDLYFICVTPCPLWCNTLSRDVACHV